VWWEWREIILVRLIFTLFVRIINNIHFGCFFFIWVFHPSTTHKHKYCVLPNSIYVFSNFYHFPHNLSLPPPSLPGHLCKEKYTLMLLLPSHIGTLWNIILARSSSIILMKQKKIFHEFSCLGQKGGVRERGRAKWENLHFIQAFSNNNPTVCPRALPRPRGLKILSV